MNMESVMFFLVGGMLTTILFFIIMFLLYILGDYLTWGHGNGKY